MSNVDYYSWAFLIRLSQVVHKELWTCDMIQQNESSTSTKWVLHLVRVSVIEESRCQVEQSYRIGELLAMKQKRTDNWCKDRVRNWVRSKLYFFEVAKLMVTVKCTGHWGLARLRMAQWYSSTMTCTRSSSSSFEVSLLWTAWNRPWDCPA